ncbi:hypothetical protein IEO21_00904 [Rhodonia placenta]|uniref:Survival motor neuron interacting protein 1 n=1 Tax=Rhodonia placenta TaxID=104341 RepID=A0A8H7PAX7_9APHY|nr:hypothetical protein IEO21_00904 [Postia placenta]
MAPKRKRTDGDSSDDDEPSAGKQVLPVANLPEDFDGVPMDGLQYLFTVRRDARTLPHVTRVVNPYEVKTEVSAAAAASDQMSTPHPGLPSEEWRDLFLRRFRNFRKNSIQPTIHADTSTSSSTTKVIPDMRDRDRWWLFLAGRPSSEWNPPKQPNRNDRARNNSYHSYGGGMRGYSGYQNTTPLVYNDHRTAFSTVPHETWLVHSENAEPASTGDPAASLPTSSGTPVRESRPDFGGERPTEAATPAVGVPPEPTPSLMQHIDHRYALHLLMYFTHWIRLYLEDDNSATHLITASHARWIFVLLSRVEDFVYAEDTAHLRDLVRACLSLIQKRKRQLDDASPESITMDETSCWIVITAITGVWGQRDLWMDAEAALREVQS